MDNSQTGADTVGKTQLYLAIPLDGLDISTRSPAQLTEFLQGIAVAAVRLCPPETTKLDSAALRPLVSHFQTQTIAVMIQDDVALAQSVAADGVHLSWRTDIVDAYGQARAELGETTMIGADAGKSRHDAMVLGERSADYIAFGVPAHVKDQQSARNRQLDLVTWWADVFEIPVVATDISSDTDFENMINAGADFVSATLPPHSIDQPHQTEFMQNLARFFPAPAAKT